MKPKLTLPLLGLVTTTIASLAQQTPATPNTFGKDVEILQKSTDAVVLRQGEAAIIVVPAFQGRVMTSTASGDGGPGSGWINHALVSRGLNAKREGVNPIDEHMLAFGGEERFWMGPEGGQYSLFFAPGTPFDFAHWFTPPPIDSEPWATRHHTDTSITLSKDFSLLNHSNIRFEIRAERTVDLLSPQEIAEVLRTNLPDGVKAVAYRSHNTVTNMGGEPWTPQTGLLSIWLLCMFQPSPTTTVFIPYIEGREAALGPIVNADYFGQVPADRLKVGNGTIYFKCDGTQRGKIGIPPRRSKGIAGSYDPIAGRVTLLFAKNPSDSPGYVNSKWEIQKDPLSGDFINSYNDGPVDATGKQMGPFYELESSSPALALEPGKSASHIQTIIHLYGTEAALQKAVNALGLPGLDSIKQAFSDSLRETRKEPREKVSP